MDLDELIERFEFFDDWEERYGYLIDLGKKLPPMHQNLKTDQNLVQGCLSQVWVVGDSVDIEGELIMKFDADSDSVIVKGLTAIVLMIYSNKTAEKVLETDLSDLFTRLKLDAHLSQNRRNGFLSMIAKIKTISKRAL